MLRFRFTFGTVEGLSPCKDYQFRVMAENFYGRSEPCEPTSVFKTETVDEGRRRKGLPVEGKKGVASRGYVSVLTLICVTRYCGGGTQDKWAATRGNISLLNSDFLTLPPQRNIRIRTSLETCLLTLNFLLVFYRVCQLWFQK